MIICPKGRKCPYGLIAVIRFTSENPVYPAYPCQECGLYVDTACTLFPLFGYKLLCAQLWMKPKTASYYKQNRLKQLRAFCYTAKSGNISRAAEQLYLSQTSVSLQIQALFEIALPMVEGMDSLRDTFADRCRDLNSGYLNVAAGEATTLYILPIYLKRFAGNRHFGKSRTNIFGNLGKG